VRFGVLRFPAATATDVALPRRRARAPRRAGRAGGSSGTRIARSATWTRCWCRAGSATAIYLRAGAMAAHSPIMAAVKHVRGARRARARHLQRLPDPVRVGAARRRAVRNASLRFECRDVHCLVEGRPTPYTHAIPAGRHIRMSIAHAEGRYVHPDVDALEAEGRVVFRYCSADGGVTEAANPNGSTRNIAGICNAAGNVVGLMPHPERACEALLGPRGRGRTRPVRERAGLAHRGSGAGVTAMGTRRREKMEPEVDARAGGGTRHDARRIRAAVRRARAEPLVHRARHDLGDVERALLLQVVARAPQEPADERAAGDPGARARTRG
jgi:phosphoribosylformylglycinamidine synthase